MRLDRWERELALSVPRPCSASLALAGHCLLCLQPSCHPVHRAPVGAEDMLLLVAVPASRLFKLSPSQPTSQPTTNPTHAHVLPSGHDGPGGGPRLAACGAAPQARQAWRSVSGTLALLCMEYDIWRAAVHPLLHIAGADDPAVCAVNAHVYLTCLQLRCCPVCGSMPSIPPPPVAPAGSLVHFSCAAVVSEHR